jgi:hypothetical protein
MRTYFKEKMSDFDTCSIARASHNTALLLEAWYSCFIKKLTKVTYRSGIVTTERLGFRDPSTIGGFDVG